ncbi:hypothetical protein QJS10_CPB13g00609 [Acorus calamus]|uniref:FAD dependent oxidoreductase domain-containing protein n=1 Tax=Acorus calamus TaxID=4465 RepID=A0AAV9DHE1_ACOCL|nr:hypothetical protein QJS10_CPB13g00609 [Acorus calamus]
MESYEEVVIVGGGIAGLATAVGLKRVGVRSLVLERSGQLRATGAALTLFPNAWRVLGRDAQHHLCSHGQATGEAFAEKAQLGVSKFDKISSSSCNTSLSEEKLKLKEEKKTPFVSILNNKIVLNF